MLEFHRFSKLAFLFGEGGPERIALSCQLVQFSAEFFDISLIFAPDLPRFSDFVIQSGYAAEIFHPIQFQNTQQFPVGIQFVEEGTERSLFSGFEVLPADEDPDAVKNWQTPERPAIVPAEKLLHRRQNSVPGAAFFVGGLISGRGQTGETVHIGRGGVCLMTRLTPDDPCRIVIEVPSGPWPAHIVEKQKLDPRFGPVAANRFQIGKDCFVIVVSVKKQYFRFCRFSQKFRGGPPEKGEIRLIFRPEGKMHIRRVDCGQFRPAAFGIIQQNPGVYTGFAADLHDPRDPECIHEAAVFRGKIDHGTDVFAALGAFGEREKSRSEGSKFGNVHFFDSAARSLWTRCLNQFMPFSHRKSALMPRASRRLEIASILRFCQLFMTARLISVPNPAGSVRK